MNTALSLRVYYKENATQTRIYKILDLAGVPHNGSGTMISGFSDVSFDFDNRHNLGKAIGRIRKALGRKATFEVEDGRGIVHGTWEKK